VNVQGLTQTRVRPEVREDAARGIPGDGEELAKIELHLVVQKRGREGPRGGLPGEPTGRVP
jgi:hypothetical protein